jgi:hypothetical protein
MNSFNLKSKLINKKDEADHFKVVKAYYILNY